MKTSRSITHLMLSAVVFLLMGALDANAQCELNLTPESNILSPADQTLIAGWLQEEFLYESELVFDSNTATDLSDFHTACDGLSNTLVVTISEEENILGGYNEGAWSSTQEVLTGLDNNFLFSVTNQEVYPAIPGGQHIANNDFLLPYFGGSVPDLRIAQIGTGSGLCVNQLGTNYECPAPIESDCDSYLNNGISAQSYDDRFYVTRFEVWQLKTTGTPLAQDTDNDGVCDEDEIVGCQDPLAANYDANATDSGPCDFPVCSAEITPGSALLSVDEQTLLHSWLPEGHDFEATLVMDSDVSGFTASTFHAECDGFSNTVLIAITEQGFVIGGYNEGVWASDGQIQYGLNGNFLFSITTQEKFNAIPGEPHIYNGGSQGPVFGDNFNPDYFTFSNASDGVLVINELGNSYECPSLDALQCTLYLNDGLAWGSSNDRFRISHFEVWQLNTSGVPLFDENTLGGCKDELAINYNSLAACENGTCIYAGCTNSADANYNPEASYDDGSCNSYASCPGDFNGDFAITAADLSGFLGAFGNDCGQ